MRSAAVFDLDRTLLSGASGPIIASALRGVGLVSTRRNPLEDLVFGVFNLVGETRPAMEISRQGARAARGWRSELVAQAAEDAAPHLLERVLPYARELLEEHRRQGRVLVLATTTPADLLGPFAAALGIDHVVATRYRVGPGGRYTGDIEGEFVWGRGKARSVRALAEREGIDLGSSFAYSDSYYDVPLLSIVGNPHAVNPDPRMAAVAALRRWPIMWLDVPPGVPKFAGLEPQTAMFLLAQPQLFPFVRFDIEGVDHLPEHGPAVIVANHRSYFDPLAVGYLLARRGRPVRFLGKKEVFDAPIVGDVARALGGIRVDRGTGSDQPLEEALKALKAGELVAMMPQGTIPRGREFFSPELRGRWGAARLAATAGVPIVPVGIWGTELVWPRSSRLPDVTNLLSPPTVTMSVGAPFTVDGADLDADTTRIMAAISTQLPHVAHRRHEPSEAELARTYPGGIIPDTDDVAHESARRPGSD